MKTLLLVLICLLSAQTSFGQREEFYDKVLNELRHTSNGYFVLLEIKSTVYNGKIGITNGDLHYLLTETRKLSERQYKKFAMSLLVKKQPLFLKNVRFPKNRHYLIVKNFNSIIIWPVDKIDEVEQTAAKGCQAFIEHYFDERQMPRQLIGDREIIAIADKLFDWQMRSRIEDFAGVMVLMDTKCPAN